MKKLHRIKAISFDLGDTLIHQYVPWITIQNFLSFYGIFKSIDEIRNAHMRILKSVKAIKESNIEKYYVNLNKLILKELNITKNADELAKKMYDEWFKFSGTELYQDVPPVLTWLKSKSIILGIISDNFSRDVIKLIKKNNIDKFFDTIVTPDISGFFKPDAGIFKEFAKRVGVKEAEILHVGDDPERDYKGALNAGFKALLISRSGETVEGVNIITSLYELISLLRC